MPSCEEFHSMNIDQRLLTAISDLGWKSPTDIQQAVIPLAIEKKSLFIQARTGSGKTAAFAIPIIHLVLEKKMIGIEQKTAALILAPTKELCCQISKDIKKLCKYASKDVNILDLAYSDDLDSLRPLLAENPDIVVGTPMKILEQIRLKRLNISRLDCLVIDEADLIPVCGYGKHMQTLRTFLPKQPIQVILMSATLGETTCFLRSCLKVDEWIRVELPEESFLPPESRLVQYVIRAEESSKYVILISIIQLKLIRGRTIIFTNSIDRCYKLKIFLEQFGIKSAVLNSELPVNSRCHTVLQFNKGFYDYLLATDETECDPINAEHNISKSAKLLKDTEYNVSRGIDFKLVSNVLNFDFPLSAIRYVHRVGRTARADQMGTAISFVNSSEEVRLPDVAKLLSQNNAFVDDKKSVVESIFRPYQFRLDEVDGFRYRATDVVGKITRKRIREARLKEIKLELINSECLKGYFDDHSADLDALRHDRPLTTTTQSYLKDIPEYMVPQSLQAMTKSLNERRKNRQRYRPPNWVKRRQQPTIEAGNTTEKNTKLRQLKSHKIKMAIARDPIMASKIKRKMARKKKAADPLFNFGKKR